MLLTSLLLATASSSAAVIPCPGTVKGLSGSDFDDLAVGVVAVGLGDAAVVGGAGEDRGEEGGDGDAELDGGQHFEGS